MISIRRDHTGNNNVFAAACYETTEAVRCCTPKEKQGGGNYLALL